MSADILVVDIGDVHHLLGGDEMEIVNQRELVM